MTNPFDEFPRADQQPSPFDEFPRADGQTRAVLADAAKVNPEDATEALRLAKRYPAPADVLLRNLQDAKLQAAVDDADARLRTSPKLAEHMRNNPWLAKQAHDDVPRLAEVESGTAAVAAAAALQGTIGLGESVWRIPDVAQRGVGAVAQGVEDLTGLPRNFNPIRGVQDLIRLFSAGELPTGYKFSGGTTDLANRIGNSNRALADINPVFADVATLGKNSDQSLQTLMETGSPRQLAQVLTDPRYWASAVGNAAPTLLAAISTGGSTVALAAMEGLDAANSAAEFEQQTGIQISDAEFTNAVAQTAAINGFLEKFGLDKVMGGGKGLTGFLKAVASEGGTEVLQQFNTNLAAWLNYDDEQSLAEGLVASGMGGAGSGGGVHAAVTAGMRVQQMAAKQSAEAEAATRGAAALEQALKAAEVSALRERDPAAFRALMADLSDNGTVYVDAEVLNQMPAEALQQMQGVAAELPEALATGGAVAVKLADAMTLLAGTPQAELFMQHARVRPDAPSAFEAEEAGKQAAEFLRQGAEEAIAQAQDQAAAQASADAVKAELQSQIAATGRYSPAVNEGMATWAAAFYTTMGARTGMTAQEFYQRFPLRVLGEAQAGGQQVMDQITPDQARETNVPVEMPAAPEFVEAVGNTPGAQVTPDGLLIDLVRFQKPEQEGAQAIRTGVFYLPAKSANVKHYKVTPSTKIPNAYGGTEKYQGETLLRRPLLVKGGTGGKAPEAAYDAIKGKGAMKLLDKAVMDVVTSRGFMTRIDPDSFLMKVEQFLGDFGGERGLANEIIRNSTQGNTLRYALQEHVIASVVRAAGYDAVVGYTKGKAGAAISEVFDVREQTYPARGMDSEVHEDFLNQPAYHGTPHRGIERFSTDKIGTGEGAQAYGWGLYFASKREIAEFYRETLTNRDQQGYAKAHLNAKNAVARFNGDAEWAAEVLADQINNTDPSDPNHKRLTDTLEMVKSGAYAKPLETPGQLYEVEIPEDSEMLLWDRPLSEQPAKVREALRAVMAKHGGIDFDEYARNGNDWRDMKDNVLEDMSEREVSEALLAAGIKGIKYLDGTSRNAGDGSYNYVVFSGDDVAIRDQFYQRTASVGPRGTFNPRTLELVLSPNADLSTFFHESGHFFLEVMADLASQPGAPAQIVDDMSKILAWFGIKGDEQVGGADSGVPLGQGDGNVVRLYHGSKQVINGPFRASSKSINTTTFGDVETERTGVFFSDNPEFSREYGDVKPYDVNIQSTADITRDLILDFADTIDAFGPERDLYVLAKNSRSWGMFEGELGRRFVAYLTEQGYDSATFQEDLETEDGRNVESNTTVVFDPARVSAADATLAQGGTPTSPQPVAPKRTPLETWRSMTLDQQRPYHERWAESIEQYVMEGKAPSAELQGPMRRFSAWLKSVYGSIKAFLASRGVAPAGGDTLGQMPAPEGVLTDENGKPLVLYHGSPTRVAGKKFDLSKSGKRTDYGNLGVGVYLTPAHFVAKAYANNTGAVEGFYVNSGPLLTFAYDENYKSNIEALARDLGVTATPEWNGPGQANPQWSTEFTEKAKGAGYVGTAGLNSDGSFAEIVVYDPANLTPTSGRPLAQGQHPTGSNIQLNDDIRRVMDRMLATDEQIQQANDAAGLTPDEDADAEASERLRKRSMADLKWAVKARDKVIAKLRKQAAAIEKAIREEVIAQVDAMPEMRAKRALDALRKGKNLNDATQATTADAFGYASVEQMLQAIDAYGSRKDAIDAITQRRMLEEHGDLVDEDAIRLAANEAVHNEARARSLATELRTQREMLNPRADTGEVNAAGSRITVNTLLVASRQFAAGVVARTTLADLRNRAWQHTAAERRAAKRWAEATAAGKTEEAVKAKQDQLLNNAAAKAVMEARAEAQRILDFFKRVAKGNSEEVVDKGRDADVVNAARAVLAAYGVQTATTKAAVEYLEAVKRNDPETYNVLAPIVDGATRNAQPLDALTFDQLLALREDIDAMWHLAKRMRQMEVAGNLIDIEDAADEMHARMVEVGIPDTVPGEAGAVTKAEERKRWVQFARALLSRVEQWTERMDGKWGGPFTRYVFQPVKQAADAYRADRLVYRRKYQALVDSVAPSLTHGLIEAPELGYTFGRGHNGIGGAELLHAILHTGNESNKRKLLLGRQWAEQNADGTLDTRRWDAFITRMVNEGKLTKAHYDFAQGVWDLLEETKPLAQKAHRDVFGRYFAEVTADEFVTPFGTYRGGYVPAQADPAIVNDADMRALAEMENESMAYSFPATNKGFTKSRVDYNRPLKLDLRTIPQHIDKVLLFSHMEPAVRGVAKLLRNKGVSQALGRIDPAAYSGMLLPWLNRSARQQVETPVMGDGRVSRVLSALRSRAGAAVMFANLSNTLQQVTGFSNALVLVKGSHVRRGVAQMIAHPKQTRAAVAALSPYMANRMSDEVAAMNDEMQAILLDPSLYERAQAWAQRHSYFLQSAVDNAMSPMIWLGAYNQALAEGQSEADAVAFADGVIRKTQGSTLPEDVSRMETGPAYARMFTQFVGYFNMMANTNGTALAQIAGEMGLRKGAGKALGVLFYGMLAPIWVAEAIALAFKGGPDDEDDDGYLDDWLAAVFGMGTIKGTLAQVPFVAQLGQVVVNRFNPNPADDRFSLSPAVSLLESAASVPFDVYKAITDGELNKKLIRDSAALASLVTGMPVTAFAKPAGYAADVAAGKVDPTGPVDTARGLVTGVASHDSKQ